MQIGTICMKCQSQLNYDLHEMSSQICMKCHPKFENNLFEKNAKKSSNLLEMFISTWEQSL